MAPWEAIAQEEGWNHPSGADSHCRQEEEEGGWKNPSGVGCRCRQEEEEGEKNPWGAEPTEVPPEEAEQSWGAGAGAARTQRSKARGWQP